MGMMARVSARSPLPSWLPSLVICIVALVWAISSLARFANPERYPIPAEIHYLMGATLSVIGGGAVGLFRRNGTTKRNGEVANGNG